MGYYDGLKTAWNSPTQPPAGITGTPLTALSTPNKIIAINGWTIVGSVPATFFVPGVSILNCINWAEFVLLTEPQQQNILLVCSNPGLIMGGAGSFVGGMFVSYFSLAGPTIAALTALAKSIITPWWQAPWSAGGGGLFSPVTAQDLVAAGGLS